MLRIRAPSRNVRVEKLRLLLLQPCQELIIVIEARTELISQSHHDCRRRIQHPVKNLQRLLPVVIRRGCISLVDIAEHLMSPLGQLELHIKPQKIRSLERRLRGHPCVKTHMIEPVVLVDPHDSKPGFQIHRRISRHRKYSAADLSPKLHRAAVYSELLSAVLKIQRLELPHPEAFFRGKTLCISILVPAHFRSHPIKRRRKLIPEKNTLPHLIVQRELCLLLSVCHMEIKLLRCRSMAYFLIIITGRPKLDHAIQRTLISAASDLCSHTGSPPVSIGTDLQICDVHFRERGQLHLAEYPVPVRLRMLTDHMPPRKILFKGRIHCLRQPFRRIIHFNSQCMFLSRPHKTGEIIDMGRRIALLLPAADGSLIDPHSCLPRPLQEQDDTFPIPFSRDMDLPLIDSRP